MKLADVPDWDAFEPLVDSGLFPMATCPACREFTVVNVWEQPGGWLVQCVKCRQPVPADEVDLVKKEVVEMLGHDATVHDADTAPFRRPLN